MMHSIFKRLVLSLAVGVFFSTASVSELHAAIPSEKTSFHLFLLVGQSNMAGRGKLDDAARTPHPRVYVLSKDGSWGPAVDPLHFDKPKIVGVGPGRAFAEAALADDSDRVIGLIPCAVGGSPISTWKPGAYYSVTRSHPWDDAIRRGKRAMQDGVLKGILWHQGESDSKPELSSAYEAALHDLVARFRSELGVPDVPFVAGQMGIFDERPWSADKRKVDRVHQSLPQKVPYSAFAKADSLNHKGDEVHFDTASARILGQRYYEAWKSLMTR